MSKTRTRSSATVAHEAGFTETRVDAPHVLGTAAEVAADSQLPAESSPAAEVAAALNLAVAAPELRAPIDQHARQLAEHLSARQQELDRREAQFNAAHAELDSHWRNSRLWLQERQQELSETENELAERKSRLDALSEQLDERATQLAASEQAHAAACRRAGFDSQLREQDLARSAEELKAAKTRLEQQETLLREAHADIARLRREAEEACRRERQQVDQERTAALERVRLALTALERRRTAIESEAARLDELRRKPSAQQVAYAEKLTAWESRLEAQEDRLTREEKLCERHLTELQSARQAIERDREDLSEQLKLERQKIVGEQRRAARELDQQRRRVADETAELDGRREALEQLRADLNQVHRESLELRLATEELCAQLSAHVSPAVLTQSLAQTRARLADHHRLALTELGERHHDLERLRSELTEVQDQLNSQKRELQQWAATRQAEFDRQAERLAARQNELAAAEAEQLETAQQWERQRLSQQQEIRRLAAALRRAEAVAA